MLNNHGISMKDMIILSSIILFCLLMIVFYGEMFASSLGNEANNSSNSSTNETKEVVKRDYTVYKKYEEKMAEAALKYMNFYNYKSLSDDIVLDLSLLIERGFVEKFYDYYDNSLCTGKVLVSEDNGTFKTSSYLNCSNYNTTD